MAEKPTYEDLERRIKELEKSRFFFEILLDTLPELVSYIDKNHLFKFANKPYRKLFNIDPASVAQLHPRDVIGKKAFQKVAAKHEAALLGQQQDYESNFILPNGEPFYFRAKYLPHIENGHVEGFLAIVQDTTAFKKAEQEYLESESLFRGLYNYMTSGSAIYEVINEGSKGYDYIVKNFNKKSLEIEGKTLDQVVGKSLFDLRPNIDDYGLIPVMKKVWETGEAAYFPSKIYQDETFSNFYENYIFKVPTGEVVTIYNDVTEQKNAEIALRKSEERFALAMEFANDGLFDWNLETNEIYYSPAWKRMLGYEDDELPNDFSIWEKLTKAEDVKRSWKMQNELINKKRNNFAIEFKMKHKNGHWIDILSRANAIFNEYDKAIRIIGTHVDITERKLAEIGLLKKKKEAERYLNLAGVMFIGLNRYGNVNVANEKACEVLECTNAEIVNQNWFDNFIPQRIRKNVRNVFLQLIDGEIEPVEYYENPVITKSGKEKTIAWHNTVIMDEDNHAIGILGSGEDITEKLKLQAQLHQAQKMEAIGNLAGGIAHDFNNILSSIIGFTELALDEVKKGTALEDCLQEVYSAGKRAKDLVKQILAFARQSDEKIGPIQPSTIAKEVLGFIRSTIPTTIEIQQEIESESLILGNATQIHQVLMNLCTNAAYAMEDSSGVLNVSLKDVVLDRKDLLVGMRPGDYVEIKVSDTGTGIAPEIINSIFEPYFTTKAPGEGTGLGLAMVHGVVESYGGKITVDSQIGKRNDIYDLPAYYQKTIRSRCLCTRRITSRDGTHFVCR